MAGIYVHFPFCRAKCAYCDFYSIADGRLMAAYPEAVAAEFNARKGELGSGGISTLYFGGGTPSSLPLSALEATARLLYVPSVEEFTIEVNPEDVNPDAVGLWAAMGVNRVSMGVQSLVDSELKSVGRRHSADDAIHAIEILKSGGMENISADLIYGLPGQTCESFAFSLNRLLDTGIQHLSAYLLSYEPGTLLWRRLQRGLVEEASEEMAYSMYRMLCHVARERGFNHYEISNFALPEMESRHNSAYWTLEPYLGLGPGAHSLGADGIRRYNEPSLKEYMLNPVASIAEEETEEERLDDFLLISLRTQSGLNLSRLNENRRSQLLAAAENLPEGTLVREGDSLRIPESHWLRSDAIIRELLFG